MSVPESATSYMTVSRHKNKHCLVRGCDGKFVTGKNWSRHLNTSHAINQTDEFGVCHGTTECKHYPKCSNGKSVYLIGYVPH